MYIPLGQLSLPSPPSRVDKWVPALTGKEKAGMVHSISGWTWDVQIKLWYPLRMHAIPEHLRGAFTKRRYTNPRLPLLSPLVNSCHKRWSLTLCDAGELQTMPNNGLSSTVVWRQWPEQTLMWWSGWTNGIHACDNNRFTPIRFLSAIVLSFRLLYSAAVV